MLRQIINYCGFFGTMINDAVLDPNACSQWCIHRDVTGDNKCVNIQLLYFSVIQAGFPLVT